MYTPIMLGVLYNIFYDGMKRRTVLPIESAFLVGIAVITVGVRWIGLGRVW